MCALHILSLSLSISLSIYIYRERGRQLPWIPQLTLPVMFILAYLKTVVIVLDVFMCSVAMLYYMLSLLVVLYLDSFKRRFLRVVTCGTPTVMFVLYIFVLRIPGSRFRTKTIQNRS